MPIRPSCKDRTVATDVIAVNLISSSFKLCQACCCSNSHRKGVVDACPRCDPLVRPPLRTQKLTSTSDSATGADSHPTDRPSLSIDQIASYPRSPKSMPQHLSQRAADHERLERVAKTLVTSCDSARRELNPRRQRTLWLSLPSALTCQLPHPTHTQTGDDETS